MTTRIVLGYPYEGAFYWLMSAERWRGAPLKSQHSETHPYYKTLYGDAPHNVVDEVASLCLLYDEIYIAPADCPLPDWKTKQTGQHYHHEELGILTDWDWQGDRQRLDEAISMAQADPIVQHCLRRIPPSAQRQIIRSTVVQIAIRDRFDADIAASRPHRRVIDRVRLVLGAAGVESVGKAQTLTAGISAAFDLASLRFSLSGVDEFIALRTDKRLKAYAASFRKALDSLPEGQAVEQALYTAMLEAMNASQIADKIAGGLSVGATLSGAVSLIPIIGTVAGAIGLAADASARAAAKIKSSKSWWALAPEVSSVLTKARIRKHCEEIQGLCNREDR